MLFIFLLVGGFSPYSFVPCFRIILKPGSFEDTPPCVLRLHLTVTRWKQDCISASVMFLHFPFSRFVPSLQVQNTKHPHFATIRSHQVPSGPIRLHEGPSGLRHHNCGRPTALKAVQSPCDHPASTLITHVCNVIWRQRGEEMETDGFL